MQRERQSEQLHSGGGGRDNCAHVLCGFRRSRASMGGDVDSRGEEAVQY